MFGSRHRMLHTVLASAVNAIAAPSNIVFLSREVGSPEAPPRRSGKGRRRGRSAANAATIYGVGCCDGFQEKARRRRQLAKRSDRP